MINEVLTSRRRACLRWLASGVAVIAVTVASGAVATADNTGYGPGTDNGGGGGGGNGGGGGGQSGGDSWPATDTAWPPSGDNGGGGGGGGGGNGGGSGGSGGGDSSSAKPIVMPNRQSVAPTAESHIVGGSLDSSPAASAKPSPSDIPKPIVPTDAPPRMITTTPTSGPATTTTPAQ